MTFVCKSVCGHMFSCLWGLYTGGMAGLLGVSLVSYMLPSCPYSVPLLRILELWRASFFSRPSSAKCLGVMVAKRHWLQALRFLLHLSEKEEEEQTWAGPAVAGSREALGLQVLRAVWAESPILSVLRLYTGLPNSVLQ